jgi:hypothetical protein
MDEKQWVNLIAELLRTDLNQSRLLVEPGKRLPYAYEVTHYGKDGKAHAKSMKYETDLLISEANTMEVVRPIVVIEAKVEHVTTHDAITYSQKAVTHKQVHPYLRYGIILGARKTKPLPGRLFRHGSAFDFMQSFKDYQPNEAEWKSFLSIIRQEIENSRMLRELIFNSRSKDRKIFTVFHRQLFFK